MSKYFRIKGIEEDEIFRNLFIDYYPSLISFALYYVGDKTIAEDLVQEVFVKLWETRERWSAVDDFSAYVYQMVRFKCFNYLRAEKIRNEATRSFTEEVDITEINNYSRRDFPFGNEFNGGFASCLPDSVFFNIRRL